MALTSAGGPHVSQRKLQASMLVRLLALSFLVGAPSPAVGQPLKTFRPGKVIVVNGLPDLVVRVQTAPTVVSGIVSSSGPQATSVVTITVQNRFTPYGGPHEADGSVWVVGSAAQNVLVTVDLWPNIVQVGGFAAQGGFQCAVTPNKQNVMCFAGNIPVGATVTIQFEVMTTANQYCTHAEIYAHVDPYSWIREASDANNEASGGINFDGPC